MRHIYPKHTTLRRPLTTLLDFFSIDFSGPFNAIIGGFKYLLVFNEHFTGWCIAKAKKNAKASTFIDFIQN